MKDNKIIKILYLFLIITLVFNYILTISSIAVLIPINGETVENEVEEDNNQEENEIEEKQEVIDSSEIENNFVDTSKNKEEVGELLGANEWYINNTTTSNIKYTITDYWGNEYHKDQNVAQVTWINPNATTITIPATIKHVEDNKTYSVKSISNSSVYNNTNNVTTTVSIPNGVEAIESSMFKNYKALNNVTIPNSVTYIGGSLFSGCSKLTNITISNRIKNLESYTFENCTSLKTITVPNGVEELGYDTFSGCTSLTNISLPNTLKKINKNCFYNCSSLVTFNMPDSVTDLGGTGISALFNKCSKLKNVHLSNSLTYLPTQSFQECTSLEELYLPDSIKSIGSHEFTDDSNFKRLYIPQQVSEIGWGFIADTNIKQLIFPAECRKQQIWQFGTFDGLTMVFPRTIESMDNGGTFTNSTIYGFSETPVKQWANDKGITFKELPLISYSTHVQNIGDQSFKTNGEMAGTSGKGYRLESIKMTLDTSKTGYSGGIKYRTQIQNIGWQDWKSNGAASGTSGKGLRLEAIQIELTGAIANYFDVYYRVHAQNVGWMGWAKNGASSGTEGYGYRLEGIEILILPKNFIAPGLTTNPYQIKTTPMTGITFDKTSIDMGINSKANVVASIIPSNATSKSVAWSSSNTNIATVNTSGEITSKGNIGTCTISVYSTLNPSIKATCQVKVWNKYFKGDLNGDQEVTYTDYNAIKSLTTATGNTLLAADFDMDGSITSSDRSALYRRYLQKYWVKYCTQVQNVGWQDYVKDGETAGTVGKGLRLEGIKIKLAENGKEKPIDGYLQYQTHIQNIGWESSWKSDDVLSGTEGKGLRLEAIRMKLTGNISKSFDVYYRVQAENVGWMGWAKNGEDAGTAGYGFRLEGIEIKLVEKDCVPPGTTVNHFMQK